MHRIIVVNNLPNVKPWSTDSKIYNPGVPKIDNVSKTIKEMRNTSVIIKRITKYWLLKMKIMI